MKARALKASVCLSAFFLVVYGATNWISALRPDAGVLCFGWESALPFVPLMILPYMSIDLFFVCAPFLCKNREELASLSRRIVFAIAVAGVCFLVLPLRLAFERPEVSGWLGALFDGFRTLDAPHNLVPSLHIALTIILLGHYEKHTAGPVRLVVLLWFILVALSTVLTYQHHLADVASGWFLGIVACRLFPQTAARPGVLRSVRIGLYYGAAAVAILLVAAVSRPWGTLLLWPGLALGIVAAAYLGVGPGVFGKRDGRLDWLTRLVLGPVLLGQELSLLYYRRRARAWDAVTPRVLMGRKLNHAEAAAVSRQGVTAVLDLTAEFSEAAPFLEGAYRNLPILDLTAPSAEELGEAVSFITEQASRGTVYVHCKIGYSRSAAVLGAYLLETGRAASAEEAVGLLKQARPSIVVRPEAWGALRAFEQSRSTRAAA